MGKYVAVGVLAVIVLAAATYEAPAQQGKTQQTDASVTGTYGGETAETAIQPNKRAEGEVPIGIPGTKPTTSDKTGEVLPNKPASQAREEILQYTVKAGQNLRQVAKELIGDASRWRELYAANKDRIGADPNQLKKGMVLVWKKVEGAIAKMATARRNEARSVPASVPRQTGGYVVAKGDTLYRIAKKKLGEGQPLQGDHADQQPRQPDPPGRPAPEAASALENTFFQLTTPAGREMVSRPAVLVLDDGLASQPALECGLPTGFAQAWEGAIEGGQAVTAWVGVSCSALSVRTRVRGERRSAPGGVVTRARA